MVEAVGRVFVAVPLPPEIKLALIDQLEDVDIPGKLVPPENWHLTVRFLGSVDQITYERFLHGVGQVETQNRFSIRLRGLGGFPKTSKATVVWAGIAEGLEGLAQLNEIAESAAQSASLKAEERPYRSHLTLSRVRPPTGVGHLSDTKLDLRWTCTEVVVYRSHLVTGGTRYQPLERLVLAR